jgi:hypothetical protein
MKNCFETGGAVLALSLSAYMLCLCIRLVQNEVFTGSCKSCTWENAHNRLENDVVFAE